MNDTDLHHLKFTDKEITIVGTAHVSQESADLVSRVIREETPETVCIELCASRYKSLTEKDRWRNTDLFKVIKEKKAFVLLSNLMLTSFQKRIGDKLGIKPGEEMIRGIDAAQAVGAHIHLADRDIRTTLARVWRAMGLWSKLKLMVNIVLSAGQLGAIEQDDVERMKNEDILETLLQELGQFLPALRDILIDERDQYLCHKIRSAPGRRIVAVVGAGHVPGIKRYWEKSVDMKALEEMPSPSKGMRLVKWAIPLCVLAMIVWGFFAAGGLAGRDMLTWWILANAVSAGLGASLALAHPVTILSAIAASPVTSLNPMIAAGWVAGLVEVFLGRPKVRDFEGLSQDILTVKGFWKNKVTRILLVVVFTNLGSALGTFVAIPLMLKVLA